MIRTGSLSESMTPRPDPLIVPMYTKKKGAKRSSSYFSRKKRRIIIETNLIETFWMHRTWLPPTRGRPETGSSVVTPVHSVDPHPTLRPRPDGGDGRIYGAETDEGRGVGVESESGWRRKPRKCRGSEPCDPET